MEYLKQPNEETQNIMLSYADVTITLRNKMTGGTCTPLQLSKVILAINLPYFHTLFQTFKDEKEFIVDVINIPVAQYILLRTHKIDYTPNVSNEELILYEICINSYFCAPIDLEPLYKFSGKIENYDLLYETLNSCNYSTNSRLIAVLRKHIPHNEIFNLPPNIKDLIEKPPKLFVAYNNWSRQWDLYDIELNVAKRNVLCNNVLLCRSSTNLVVYATYDNVIIRDIHKGEDKYTIPCNSNNRCIKISCSGNYIAHLSISVYIYRIGQSEGITLDCKVHQDLNTTAFSKDDTLFVIKNDEKFCIFDINKKEYIAEISREKIIALRFMNNGDFLSIDANGRVCQWHINYDCHMVEPTKTWETNRKESSFVDTSLSQNDKLFAILYNNNITVLNLEIGMYVVKVVYADIMNKLLIFLDDNNHLAYFNDGVKYLQMDSLFAGDHQKA